jgi:hypothetical protein
LGVFGNPHASQWLGGESTLLQVTLECSQIVVQVLLEHRNADFVNPGGTSVLFHRFECLHHQPIIDTTGERMHFPFLGHVGLPTCR